MFGTLAKAISTFQRYGTGVDAAVLNFIQDGSELVNWWSFQVQLLFSARLFLMAILYLFLKDEKDVTELVGKM